MSVSLQAAPIFKTFILDLKEFKMVTCKKVIDLVWSARWSPRGLGGVLKGGTEAVIGA